MISGRLLTGKLQKYRNICCSFIYASMHKIHVDMEFHLGFRFIHILWLWERKRLAKIPHSRLFRSRHPTYTECILDAQCAKNVLIQTVFFCSVFSHILTKKEDLWSKSPYSVQIQKNTDQKKLLIWTFFTQWLIGRTEPYVKVLYVRSV